MILGDDDYGSHVASDSEDDWLPDKVFLERAASDSDEPANNLDSQEVSAAQENDELIEEDDEEDENAEEEEAGEAEVQSSESEKEDQMEVAVRAEETLT